MAGKRGRQEEKQAGKAIGKAIGKAQVRAVGKAIGKAQVHVREGTGKRAAVGHPGGQNRPYFT